jgi:hypothetical protein
MWYSMNLQIVNFSPFTIRYLDFSLLPGREKIHNHVEFPLDDLDLSPYCEKLLSTSSSSSSSSSSTRLSQRMASFDSSLTALPSNPWWNHGTKFRLAAVISHLGRSMDEGHYMATCFSHSRNCWINFNDQRVSFVSPSEVLKSEGYLLFYERHRDQ